MTKSIRYSGGVSGIDETQVTDIRSAATGWHDPSVGQEVQRITTEFEDGGTQRLRVAISLSGVGVNEVQTRMDGLASAISGLPGDWGTVDTIKEDMSMS